MYTYILIQELYRVYAFKTLDQLVVVVPSLLYIQQALKVNISYKLSICHYLTIKGSSESVTSEITVLVATGQ